MKYVLNAVKRFILTRELRRSQDKRWTVRRDARETVLRSRLRSLR